MRLKALTYGDRLGEEGPVPETVTVEMTIEEVVALADVAGSVLGRGQATSSPIYVCLADLLNRHFEEGVDGARHELATFPWRFRAGTRDHDQGVTL